MLKILAVVLMLGATPDGGKDLYIFTDPEFSTMQECQSWVQGNPNLIYWQVAQHYGQRPIENIFCVNEKRLPGLLDPNQPKPGELSI
mgnify:FL=1|jgi:hypothetical protein